MNKQTLYKNIICAFSFILLMSISAAYASTPINAMVAIVGKEIITQTQLNNRVKQIKAQFRKSNTPLPSNEVLSKQVLQQMINTQLQIQAATSSGLKVSATQLTQALQRIAKQNHMSLAELYKSVTKTGYTPKTFRDEIKNEILIQTLEQRDVASRISISKQEVDDYLHIMKNTGAAINQYHLQNILIELPAEPTTAEINAAKKKAEQVLAKLHKGGNFKTLAASVSSDQQALQGGDLGWRRIAELPTPFVRAVEKMKAGEVAGPIRTPNGFHIIKLLAIRNDAGLKGDAAQQRKEVEQMLFERKLNEEIITWAQGLRSQAYIKILSTK